MKYEPFNIKMSTDDKIKEFVGASSICGFHNAQRMYSIDEMPTVINSVHGNFAKGAIIVNGQRRESYIAKVGTCYAHGDSIAEAFHFANAKAKHVIPYEQRIEEFIKKYPSLDIIADNKDLFSWHNYLTDSCLAGRRVFAIEHSIDVENGSMTIREFIRLTKNSYGGDNIKALEKAYNKGE